MCAVTSTAFNSLPCTGYHHHPQTRRAMWAETSEHVCFTWHKGWCVFLRSCLCQQVCATCKSKHHRAQDCEDPAPESPNCACHQCFKNRSVKSLKLPSVHLPFMLASYKRWLIVIDNKYLLQIQLQSGLARKSWPVEQTGNTYVLWYIIIHTCTYTSGALFLIQLSVPLAQKL